MKITRVRDAVAAIPSPMRNAVISFDRMTISVVAVETDVIRDGKPVIGYGFCSNGRYAQPGIIRERLVPRLMETPPADLLDESGENLSPQKVSQAMMRDEKPGGHGDRAVAVAAIDMAVWDAVAKIAGAPLWRVLADRYSAGRALDELLVYSGGGYYYPGDEKQGLIDEMKRTRDLGYRLCKMKIGGADLETDRRRIEWALSVVGEGDNLAVDANGRFALAYGRMVAAFGLCWFEEPVDPLDYRAHAVLADELDLDIATGENLFSVPDYRNLLRHGGLRPTRDWLQPDPALAYGLTECLKIIELAEASGWTRARVVPHGGHQMGLHMAIGLRLGGTESYPGVFRPYGGFADNAHIENGMIKPPAEPGLGVEAKTEMFADLRRNLGFD